MTAPTILVGYQSAEGQTAAIAERMRAVLTDRGATVTVAELDGAPAPGRFDGVVVGDSIHAGRHSKPLARYLQAHADELNAMPAALFQVSLTSANPDDEHTAQARAMVDELLADSGFDPDAVAMFAGALAYTRYGWVKRQLMKHISGKEGGDTDTSRDYEYTDWEAVEQFASDVYDVVAASTPA